MMTLLHRYPWLRNTSPIRGRKLLVIEFVNFILILLRNISPIRGRKPFHGVNVMVRLLLLRNTSPIRGRKRDNIGCTLDRHFKLRNTSPIWAGNLYGPRYSKPVSGLRNTSPISGRKHIIDALMLNTEIVKKFLLMASCQCKKCFPSMGQNYSLASKGF